MGESFLGNANGAVVVNSHSAPICIIMFNCQKITAKGQIRFDVRLYLFLFFSGLVPDS